MAASPGQVHWPLSERQLKAAMMELAVESSGCFAVANGGDLNGDDDDADIATDCVEGIVVENEYFAVGTLLNVMMQLQCERL